MAKAPQRPTLNSPKGAFKFPKLTTPDTKFKAEGEYSVKLIVASDAPGVADLISKCDKEAADSLKEAKANAKNAAEAKKWETKYLPYAHVEDDETGEPTGDVEFKFTMKASGVSKKTGKPWTRKPALFDAKGKPIKGEVEIGGGTIGKISFQIIPYAPTTTVGASCKLALEAVQIIELRQFGDKSASAYGFGEEDGYEYTKDEDGESPFSGDEGEAPAGEEEVEF
ncbi:ssDNA-binding protein [Neorhizobium galegae]|uniref:Possible DNA-dependent RNA polymerase n=1 Tax=Neorhizobium galegae bv. orientalis str. HAMBI 540 TaxID=1028800 RepID=A0A068SNW0_NEOGA|nr:DUF2815 family protein [Neorhizobium galegae]CDN47544.1 Possible DNA-dependent RNA polymerase [Neorhizobium galegae bv. orientalis str. HAMBI 540]